MTILNLGTFNAEGAKALVYGLGKGLAYTGVKTGFDNSIETSIQTNCFYALYGLVDTVDLMAYDV
jgi:hypothetical protein